MKQKISKIILAFALIGLSDCSEPRVSGTSYTLTGEGDNLTLTITGTGDMPNYPNGTAPWRTQIINIKTLIIENGVTSIGNYAFEYCFGLTFVTIPNSVKTIGYTAFYNCTSLTSITIPNGVTSIGERAFSACYNLTSVNIGNSVTTIDVGAFWSCSGLTSVTIPNNVAYINDYAFYDCTGLTEIHNQKVVPQSIKSNVFSTATQSTLYVPVGSLSAYQNAPVWKDFLNIVEE